MACMFGCVEEKKGNCSTEQFYQRYMDCEIYKQKLEEYKGDTAKFIEEFLGIELNQYQKMMLREMYGKKK
jgi:hypothetical protein